MSDDTLNKIKGSVSDGALKDYANPKAALTIGASSAMVIAFTSSLCSSFPCLPSATTALVMGMIFGTAMVCYLNEKMLIKVFYGFIVAMLIFHTARGGNETLGEASGGSKVNIPAEIIIPKVSNTSYNFSIIPSAYADDDIHKKLSVSTNLTDKFYFAYMNKDGCPVYTNKAGVVHVDTNFKQSAFKRWKF